MSNFAALNAPEWLQTSFASPVPAPNAEADAAPTVCVRFASAWLPYVLGALFQLCQPAAYIAASPGAADATSQAQQLMDIFVEAGGGCMEIRWNDATCSLQVSTDNGATWTDISGWDLPGVQRCIMSSLQIRITGGSLQWSTDGGSTWQSDGAIPPPNPQGVSTDQQACNIATWLAMEIISNSLGSVATSITDAKSLIDTFEALLLAVVDLNPITAIAVTAATVLFNGVTSIGAATVSSAASDPVLHKDLQCAIYNAIKADGFVTDANYAAIVANITAISYGTPAIIGLIIDYLQGVGPLTGLGAAGLEQMQYAGSLYLGDCTACNASDRCADLETATGVLIVTGLTNWPTAAFSVIGWTESGDISPPFVCHDRAAASAGMYTAAGYGGSGGGGYVCCNNGVSQLCASDTSSVWAGAGSSAMVWSGSGLSVYRNGVLIASQVSAIAPASDGSQPVAIGHTGYTSDFRGKMGDVRIYDGALSADDIAAYHAAGFGTYPVLSSATLKAQWKMNETSGRFAADSSGNGYTAEWSTDNPGWSTWP